MGSYQSPVEVTPSRDDATIFRDIPTQAGLNLQDTSVNAHREVADLPKTSPEHPAQSLSIDRIQGNREYRTNHAGISESWQSPPTNEIRCQESLTASSPTLGGA